MSKETATREDPHFLNVILPLLTRTKIIIERAVSHNIHRHITRDHKCIVASVSVSCNILFLYFVFSKTFLPFIFCFSPYVRWLAFSFVYLSRDSITPFGSVPRPSASRSFLKKILRFNSVCRPPFSPWLVQYAISLFPIVLSTANARQHVHVAACRAGVLKASVSQRRLQSSGTAGEHIIKQSQTVQWAVSHGYLIS